MPVFTVIQVKVFTVALCGFGFILCARHSTGSLRSLFHISGIKLLPWKKKIVNLKTFSFDV